MIYGKVAIAIGNMYEDRANFLTGPAIPGIEPFGMDDLGDCNLIMSERSIGSTGFRDLNKMLDGSAYSSARPKDFLNPDYRRASIYAGTALSPATLRPRQCGGWILGSVDISGSYLCNPARTGQSPIGQF